MATIEGLSHTMAFEFNGLLYVIGYRSGGQYLRRSADGGATWLKFADDSEERLVAMPTDEQRVGFVKMGSQGRALLVAVSRHPAIDVYVSVDDGESWECEG